MVANFGLFLGGQKSFRESRIIAFYLRTLKWMPVINVTLGKEEARSRGGLRRPERGESGII